MDENKQDELEGCEGELRFVQSELDKSIAEITRLKLELERRNHEIYKADKAAKERDNYISFLEAKNKSLNSDQ